MWSLQHSFPRSSPLNRCLYSSLHVVLYSGPSNQVQQISISLYCIDDSPKSQPRCHMNSPRFLEDTPSVTTNQFYRSRTRPGSLFAQRPCNLGSLTCVDKVTTGHTQRSSPMSSKHIRGDET